MFSWSRPWLCQSYIYLATLAYDLNISIEGAVEDKLKKNGKKYPVDKCYGKADKYQGD
jgi:hypothetical protein